MKLSDVLSPRASAKASGASRYFTGKPCPQGHLAERLTRNSECVACEAVRKAAPKDLNLVRATARAVYAERKETMHARQRLARQLDPERFQRTQSAYCQRNPEKRKESSRQYYEKNRGKYLQYNRNRETGLKSATPAWADKQAIEAVYLRAKRLQLETGLTYHVDHHIPLKGVNRRGEHVVCGLHVHYNLVPLPEKENRAKTNKFEVT